MNREQLISSTKRYASLAAAKTCALFATVFTWLAQRCDDADTFFISIEARHRR